MKHWNKSVGYLYSIIVVVVFIKDHLWYKWEPTVTEVFHENYPITNKTGIKGKKLSRFNFFNHYIKGWNQSQLNGMIWNVKEDNEYNWGCLEWNGLQLDNMLCNVMGGN